MGQGAFSDRRNCLIQLLASGYKLAAWQQFVSFTLRFRCRLQAFAAAAQLLGAPQTLCLSRAAAVQAAHSNRQNFTIRPQACGVPLPTWAPAEAKPSQRSFPARKI